MLLAFFLIGCGGGGGGGESQPTPVTEPHPKIPLNGTYTGETTPSIPAINKNGVVIRCNNDNVMAIVKDFSLYGKEQNNSYFLSGSLYSNNQIYNGSLMSPSGEPGGTFSGGAVVDGSIIYLKGNWIDGNGCYGTFSVIRNNSAPSVSTVSDVWINNFNDVPPVAIIASDPAGGQIDYQVQSDNVNVVNANIDQNGVIALSPVANGVANVLVGVSSSNGSSFTRFKVHIKGTLTRNNADETIFDQGTGLTWQDNADVIDVLVYTHLNNRFTERGLFPSSVSYCDNLSLAGKTGWRVPTITEMESLESADGSKELDKAFVNYIFGSRGYISSTRRSITYSDLSISFVYVSLNLQSWTRVDADVNYKTNNIRCVHD